MEVVDAVPPLGWSPTRKQLINATSRMKFEAALASGEIVRLARGHYGLPGRLGAARRAAVRVNGVPSHLSAAEHWEFAVKSRSSEPVVTVPRWRRLPEHRRRGVDVRWSNLVPDDIAAGGVATSPVRTVLDCAATLSLPEALVVADSALRTPFVTKEALSQGVPRMSPQCRPRVRRVVDLADPRPDSAFESLVRGIAADVPGLRLVPQVELAGRHPDLHDESLGLVVECDSFGHHSARADLVRDCERYNVFGLAGLCVIRFAWEHAMFREDYVRDTLATAVEVLADRPRRGTPAA